MLPASSFMPSLVHCVQVSRINKLKAVQVSEDQKHTSGFKFMFFFSVLGSTDNPKQKKDMNL